MKKILFLIILFTTPILSAQIDYALTYNSIYSGRTINFSVSKKLNEKNEVGLGLSYSINREKHERFRSRDVFHKRIYALNFGQHFGLEAFFNRSLTDIRENSFESFMFYDVQLKYAPVRNRVFYPVATTYEESTLIILYEESINYWGPFTWIENNIGFGFKTKINKQFYFTQKIGAGVDFILSKEREVPDIYTGERLGNEKFTLKLGMLIQSGFVYRIEKK